MKKLSLVFALLCATAWTTYATNIGDDFHAHYSAGANLSAYNKDMSAMVGMIDFTSGGGRTFPAADLGVNVSIFKPSSDNTLSSDSYTVLPFLVATTKIPVIDVGVVARGTSISGYTSVGGGLTYQLQFFHTLNVSLGGFYDNGRTDWYTTDHYSLSAVASADILIFTPYLGIGYDYSKLQTRGFEYNRSTSDGQVRTMVGINASPIPFLSGFVAYTMTKDSHGFTGGMGLSF